jgi:hypothetical protein
METEKESTQPSEENEVDRAPFRERMKRGLWTLGSLFITSIILFGAMMTTKAAGYGPEAGLVAVAVISVDYLVWQWGFEKFSIVLPKEFREVQSDTMD